MKYFYEMRPQTLAKHGETYLCKHPRYSACTLYLLEGKGIAVIQQQWSPAMKVSWWKELAPCLADDIYENKNFREFFKAHAAAPTNGLYPTFTARQIMWALRMKPLKREQWEDWFNS